MGDRTFGVNFGSDGIMKLRGKVIEKLKEIMGDYSDDTLVEYILVLLKNGRSKDETTRELTIFLGDDDSILFVSWLWDHLSSNLNLYAQAEQSMAEPRRDRSTQEQAHKNISSEYENDREEPSKAFTSRKHVKRKGWVQEVGNSFPLQNAVTKKIQSKDRDSTRFKRRRPLSPKPCNVMKRSLEDDWPMKRDGYGAPRRLLQFAVRDAVMTMHPEILRSVQLTNAKPMPALKKLRSVVSRSTTNTVLTEEPQRLRSVAVKASEEAAEDTTKKIYPRSVSEMSSGLEFGKESAYDGDTTMLDTNADDVVPEDLASDNDRDVNSGVITSSANKPKDSLTLQYSVAQDADKVARDIQSIDQGASYNGKEKPTSKILNISVNVNTWKPPTYADHQSVQKVENQDFANNFNNVLTAGKTNAELPKVNNVVMTEKRMAQENVQVEQHAPLPSTPCSNTTNNPLHDSESRTIFVSNVHFAATKETLSKHFSKSGDVLKVIILYEAATGKPRGAAYVEFLRKESVESALSLNGTYFMSRGLKVVRKTEAKEMPTSTQVSGSKQLRPGPSRIAYPRRCIRGAFRGQIPIKVGGRSLQWKREDPTTHTANALISPMGRCLTYVRPELKVASSMGPT